MCNSYSELMVPQRYSSHSSVPIIMGCNACKVPGGNYVNIKIHAQNNTLYKNTNTNIH